MNARATRIRLLATTAVGLYAVSALGATEAVTTAESVCTGWPTCNGSLFPPTFGPALLAWGHRASVLIVGLLLCGAAVATVRDGGRRRVLAALAVAVVSYAVEVAVGRSLFAGAPVRGIHLAVAAVVLAAVFAALTWTLDVDREGSGVADRRTSTRETQVDDPTFGLGEFEEDTDGPPGLRTRFAAYLELTKPRLMWLLSLVALAGMALAAGGVPPIAVGLPTLVGGALSIGASGVFNNVLERERDAKMTRTSDRPVVTREISAWRATAFGLVLTCLALYCFLAFVNVTAAALDLGAVAFYSVGYTLVLKPNTSWNITVGGAVGAFPALIGSAAVTGRVGLPAILLGVVVFTWTPAHFYNLALAYEDDYASGGYPMLPVVKGRSKTRRHILGYLGVTFVTTLALAAVAHADLAFVGVTSVFGALFLWAVVRLARERTDAAAFRAFHASNAYLGALLVAVVVTGVR